MHAAFDLAAGRAILARTPRVLEAWLGGLPDEWLQATEGPETWCPRDVLGHLVHGERTDWIPRARIILAQDGDRRFPPFDRTAQLRVTPPPVAEQLRTFADLRRVSLEELDSWQLDEARLSLEGIHPAFGAVSLRQLLATWVAHDLSHLSQVARVMAKHYREAVGPWRAYLSVMER
ncbi:MAG: DinB family protein [Gemmatimonadetes bacterium]|nr:DinB family protein [Gemmatimonadota bacterium]